MNKARRKALDELHARLEAVVEGLRNMVVEISQHKDDEQDYFDNMPESLQNGERGEKAQSAVEALDDALDGVGEAVDSLDAAYHSLAEATS